MGATDKKNTYFGLDVSDGWVRIVQLEAGENKPKLITYGEKEITPVSNRDNLVNTIKSLRKDLDINTNRTVVAVSNSAASTRVVELPNMAESEVSSHIRDNIATYTSLPIDSAKIDWHIMRSSQDDDHMHVLVVAAQQDAIGSVVDIVNDAGLELEALEVNGVALSRSIVHRGDEPSLIVRIGEQKTEVTLAWRRNPFAVSSLDVGIEAFLTAIETSFNVDRPQADEFLNSFGFSDTKLEGGVIKATQPHMDKITTEAQRIISDFSAQHAAAIKKIILTGPSGAIPGLSGHLSSQMSLPVEIANAWANVSYPANEHEKIMSESLKYGIASGLAQRRYV